MGISLQNLGKTKDAVDTYNMALSINPDYAEAHKSLSFTLLNCGKFPEGLDKYEWRWKTDDFLSQQRGFLQPLWDRKKVSKAKGYLFGLSKGLEIQLIGPHVFHI